MNFNRIFTITIFIFIILLLNSCTTASKIKRRGGYMLSKNKVIVDKKGISSNDLLSFSRPKPNTSFLGLFRPGVLMHDLMHNSKDRKFNRWIRKNFTTKPVLIDTIQIRNSKELMQIYLNNKGYFNSNVTHLIDTNGAKVNVIYCTHTLKPYIINKISYIFKDDTLKSFIEKSQKKSLIYPKQQYDAYLLKEERERAALVLRNHGYYNFTTDYIIYEVDSSAGNNTVDINMVFKNLFYQSKDSLKNENLESKHQRFKIDKIHVKTDFSRIALDPTKVDTSVFYDINKVTPLFYYSFYDKMQIRPSVIAKNMFFKPGDYYNQNKVDLSYSRLRSINFADYIDIKTTLSKLNSTFDKHSDINFLDYEIRMNWALMNSFTIEAEGTNAGGYSGLGTNISYSNRNLFRGGEVLRLKVRGAVEVMPSLGGEKQDKKLINSLETGADLGVTFPVILLPISSNRIERASKLSTNINLGFTLQERTYYKRYVTYFTFNYNWNQSSNISHSFTPVDLSAISVSRDSSFTSYLLGLNDIRYLNQYTNHLILALKYSFIYNNQKQIVGSKNFLYFKLNIEPAGNLFGLISKVANFNKDSVGRYSIFGINYSQYFRTDFDLRYYFALTNDRKIVNRLACGIGVPYSNSSSLPFEKGFYAGGANGLRGWHIRSLGPGNYPNTKILSFEKIGDISLEYNLEYRFPIYNFFKGALFADIGNIWQLHENDAFPNGAFKWETFLTSVAFDAGFGMRFDFSFFIFRIDGALPLYDPGKKNENRWFKINKFQLSDINLEFGLGYPF